MARDENFFLLILFTLPLDITSTLYTSQNETTKVLGETFIVICKDEAGLPVQWKGPKGDLGPRTHPRVTFAQFGTAIIFNDTRKDDAGKYICTSLSSNEWKSFSLTVVDDIKFKDTPTVQKGKEGDSITLRCEVSGTNNYTISWSLGDEELLEPKYHILGDGLYITNLTREDNHKTYICQVHQTETGILKKREIKLIVEYKPLLPVYEAVEYRWVFLGKRVNLTCEVDAEPPPKFQWLYDKKQKIIARKINVSDHISVLELVVNKTPPENFHCIATNKHGTEDKWFNLKLGIQPGAPIKVELKNATSDSLELFVELPQVPDEHKQLNMEPWWLKIKYKTDNVEDWEFQEFNITQESFTLEGLQKKTRYEVTAATKNVAGESEYTNSTYFETSKAISVHLNLMPKLLNIFLLHLFVFTCFKLA